MGLEFTKQIDAEPRILSLRTKKTGFYLLIYMFIS